jgi:hypothetical protein
LNNYNKGNMAMNNRNTGSLFKTTARTGNKKLILKGTLDLDRSLLEHLLFSLDTDEKATLDLIAWKTCCTTAGEEYYAIMAQPEYSPLETVADVDPDEIDL